MEKQDLREVRIQILVGRPLRFQVVDHHSGEVLTIISDLDEFQEQCNKNGWIKHQEHQFYH